MGPRNPQPPGNVGKAAGIVAMQIAAAKKPSAAKEVESVPDTPHSQAVDLPSLAAGRERRAIRAPNRD